MLLALLTVPITPLYSNVIEPHDSFGVCTEASYALELAILDNNIHLIDHHEKVNRILPLATEQYKKTNTTL